MLNQKGRLAVQLLLLREEEEREREKKITSYLQEWPAPIKLQFLEMLYFQNIYRKKKKKKKKKSTSILLSQNLNLYANTTHKFDNSSIPKK
jgi:hypothetical protein